MHGDFGVAEEGSGILAVQLGNRNARTDLTFIGLASHLDRPLTSLDDGGYPRLKVLKRVAIVLTDQQAKDIPAQPSDMAMVGTEPPNPSGNFL
jgi:hypothetical protein